MNPAPDVQRQAPPAHDTSLHIGKIEASGSSLQVSGNVNHPVLNITWNNHGTSNPDAHGDNSASGSREPMPGISATLSDTEKQKLVELLWFPRLDDHLTAIAEAEPKTCEWLLQQRKYESWMNAEHLEGQDGFFWIRGNPGTGKSITMKFLYESLYEKLNKNEDSHVFAFFFHNRGTELEKSTLGLYRSLLLALSRFEPDLLQEAFSNFYAQSSYIGILQESGWTQDKLGVLYGVFKEVTDLLAVSGKRLYCYIDALDECSENEVRDMVERFEHQVSRTLRVCFSSRHYPQIEIQTKFKITLETEDGHRNDIDVFIDSRLHLDDLSQDEKTIIKNGIVAKSNRLFLWVDLVIKQLNEVYRRNGTFKAISQRLNEIPKAVKEMEGTQQQRSLYGLFRDIIKRDSQSLPLFTRLMQLIYCARQPFYPRALFVALYETYGEPFESNQFTDTAMKKQILDISKGLAEFVESGEPTVQFIHESVREFLRDGGLSNVSDESVDVDVDGHEMFKTSCIEQVCAPVAGHLGLLARYQAHGSYRVSPLQVTKEAQLAFMNEADKKFPLLKYAVDNVWPHANEARRLGRTQHSFLQDFPLKSWIPLYNLFQGSYYTSSDRVGPRSHGESTLDFNRMSDEALELHALDGGAPMLYILAHHGCNELIKEPVVSRAEYGRDVRGERYKSALGCALSLGKLDTAWTLVGLDPSRRQSSATWQDAYDITDDPLLGQVSQVKDPQLLEKVLHDGTCTDPISQANLNKSSPEAIDLLVKHSKIIEFPLLPPDNMALAEQALQDQDRRALPFIRQAITLQPSLLTSKNWGNKTMFQHAVDMTSTELIDVYMEWSSDSLAAVNNYLLQAAADNNLVMTTDALSRGADISFQDEAGFTALHHATLDFAHKFGFHGDTQVLELLLQRAPETKGIKDHDGRTAFDHAWTSRSLYRLDNLVSAFIRAGLDVNTVTKRDVSPFMGDRSEARPSHKFPLVVACGIWGLEYFWKDLLDNTSCELDARDSWGRTALSWCFNNHEICHLGSWDELGSCDEGRETIATCLLINRTVDVNSRDDSGLTILEYIIRHPYFAAQDSSTAVLQVFFQHDRLDPNLVTSTGQHPLELIVSLYDDWKSGNLMLERSLPHNIVRHVGYSQVLCIVTKFLLETGRVDTCVQEQCASQAPLVLKAIIHEFLRSNPSQDEPWELIQETELCDY